VSQGGWNYLNPILISGSVDYQKIAKSRRNCLYLEKTKTETFEMRKELKCINFHTVMLTSELRNPIPSISFFENSNLKNLSSLIINGFEVTKEELEPVFSKFSLRFMSLNYCDMRKCDLSTMFVNLSHLQELRLVSCKYSKKSRLQFPENLEILETGQFNESDIIDISLCIWLKILILNAIDMKNACHVKIVISKLEWLRTLVLGCKLTDFRFFNDVFANVEVLFLEWDRILKYETIVSSPIKDLEDKNRHLDFSPLKKCSIKILCILNIDPNYTISVATPLGTGILTVKLTWPRDGTCLPQILYLQLDPHESIKRCLPFEIPQKFKRH